MAEAKELDALRAIQEEVNSNEELRLKLYKGSIKPKKMVFDQVRHIPGNKPTVTMLNQRTGDVNVEYLATKGFELVQVSKHDKLHYRIESYNPTEETEKEEPAAE